MNANSNYTTEADTGNGDGGEKEVVPSASVSDKHDRPLATVTANDGPISASAEPPRWRFVESAKKTMGYSSFAAGTVVKGLSAEEVVRTYNTSKINVATDTIGNVKETAADIESPRAKDVKELPTVGKLKIQDNDDEYEEIYEANVGEFRKKVKDDVEERDKVDTRMTDGLSTLDGEALEPSVEPSVDPSVESSVEASTKLMESTKDFASITQKPSDEENPLPDEELDASLTKPETIAMEVTPTSTDQDLDRVEKQAPKESSPAEPASLNQNSEKVEKPLEENDQQQKSKRRKWLLLLLLLIVILAIVLGVVLGGKQSSEEKNDDSSKAINNDMVTSNVTSPTNPPTSSPTAVDASGPIIAPPKDTPTPTASPSMICPLNTKLFTVLQNNRNGNTNEMQHTGEQHKTKFTWVVRDACTKKEVMKCLPCASAESTTTTTIATTATTAATSSPTSIQEDCLGGREQRRVEHNGEVFKFKLIGMNGQCVNERGLIYNWGRFDYSDNFGDCARKCVKDVPQRFDLRRAFRGYEYDCKLNRCYCLYDKSMFAGTNIDGFDATSVDRYDYDFDEESAGSGEILETKPRQGYYCGKLMKEDDTGSSTPTYSPTVWDDRKRHLEGMHDTFLRDVEDEDVDHEDGVRHINGPRLVYREDRLYAGVEEYVVNNDGAWGCLPDGNEYVFRVKPSNVAEDCCGFDPDSFIVSYDNAVVMQDELNDANDGTFTKEPSMTLPEGRVTLKKKTNFGQRTEPCPTPNPSTMPSILPSTSSTNQPTQPPIDIVFPDTNTMVPCREVVDLEMSGRINGLDAPFCGHCEWLGVSGFTCYQRIGYLVDKYKFTQLAARQDLLNQGQCGVTVDISDEVMLKIENTPYCGNVPS